MSIETEKRLLDWGKWFDYHKDTIKDPVKRCEFMEKAIDNLGHIFIHIIEDIRVLEGRGPLGQSMNVITPENSLKRAAQRSTISSNIRKDGGKLDLKDMHNG